MNAPTAGPSWKPLAPTLRRVLGVLLEKAKTTPAGYPMSVNAIVVGCNQKNNRDPLTSLDDIDVERALDELRSLGAVSEIDWLGRVSKYKHHAYEWLGVSKPESAVMTELLLRGAQPLGELRARAARMEPIADLAALKPIVDGLLARGLMIELTPAGRGQIVSHNLYLGPERAELASRFAGHAPRTDEAGSDEIVSARPTAAAARRPGEPNSLTEPRAERAGPTLTELAAQLADVREQLAQLRQRMDRLEGSGSESPG